MSGKIARALISVTDKTGIADFARQLAERGVEILSTGGTARAIRDAGVDVRPLDEFTGFPECLDGRVKTLHPKIHGGILYVRGSEDHREQVERLGIEAVDLVAVNLYAFEKTVAQPDVSLDAAIENIDIGGPSMVRSAAKNWRDVTVVTDPTDYGRVIECLDANDGATPDDLRYELACKAFALTARYDAAIANHLESRPEAPAGIRRLRLEFEHRQTLRYGENPHQEPAEFYARPPGGGATLAGARQLSGKELSYNNLLDLDAALGMLREFEPPFAVCVKHTNPCGAASGDSLADAFARAHAGDPLSAFGCVVGLHGVVNVRTAERMAEEAGFVEAVIAPAFDEEALEILHTKPKWRRNVRLICVEETGGQRGRVGAPAGGVQTAFRQISGGILVQPADAGFDEMSVLDVRTRRAPSDAELADLEFAWMLAKHVKSNAIVYVKDRSLVGLGAGQVSRVDAARIAAQKAGERAKGSVLASDAFFPFRDGVDAAAASGVTAIIQPGGSKRDDEAIAAADEHGMAMLFTGRRHFRH